MSASGDVPMKRKTPNSTGMGMYVKMGVMNTDRPIISEIRISVTRCSLPDGPKWKRKEKKTAL